MKRPTGLIHFLLLFGGLYAIGWYDDLVSLETAIVVVLLYEIGWDMPFMKTLIDGNYDLIQFIKNFNKPKRRRKRRVNNEELR